LAAEAPAERLRGYSGNRYSPAEKRALLEELKSSGETFADFCAKRALNSASLCKWKRALRERGEAGLVPRPLRGNAKGRTGRKHTPEQRRQGVEAFSKSGLTQRDFARVWGVSLKTLSLWLARYRESGPKGLEPRPRSRPPVVKPPSHAVPERVRDEIERTKRRFPDFGLRRVRDFLARFQGVRVSTGTVARTLDERGIERAVPLPKRRRSPPLPRRFERARPCELWQTDITSFVIGRARLRVYLIVFMDDYSRFIVSHGLHCYQRGEIADEALLIGIGRFGPPDEVLSDQGRQYFAWRGKSKFQRLLAKKGIHHAVARAHHPETVGKCERFWKTIKDEFIERAEFEDLGDARERLGHFIAHYNFFRPHEGIDGLVPADRFFGAREALEKHQARLSRDELSLALSSPPRTNAYIITQIGDESVSAYGERGQLVVHSSSALRKEIGLDVLGAPSAREEKRNGSSNDNGQRAVDQRNGSAAPAAPDEQEAAALQRADGDAAGSARAVESGADRRATEGAPGVRADPAALAGEGAARGGGGATVDPAAAGVAAQPTSAERYAGGTVEAAALTAGQAGGAAADERGRPAAPQEEDRGTRADGARSRGPDSPRGPDAQAEEWAAGIDFDS
jgi:transposase InsO family protein/transposase-like protein